MKSQADKPEIRRKIDAFYANYPKIQEFFDYVPVDYEKGNPLQDFVVRILYGVDVYPGEPFPKKALYDFYYIAQKETGHLKD